MPVQNLVLEINGVNHFVPFIRKVDNITKLKRRVLKEHGKRVGWINFYDFNGLLSDDHKLTDYLQKLIHQK